MTSPSKDTVRVEHTPTPWAAEGYHRIYCAAGGETICQFEDYQWRPFLNARENQAFIVRAVNAHDDLVKALELADEALDQANNRLLAVEAAKIGLRNPPATFACLQLIKKARAGISRIKTEG